MIEQPQHSEQREWTVNYHELISPVGNRYHIEDDHQTASAPSKRLKDEINAALAAAVKPYNDGWLDQAARDSREIVRLETELAAERKRREQSNTSWAETNEKLSTMLLSAQAAIEAALKAPWTDVGQILAPVDLSDLHEHDTEVRKPLVEALEDCESALAAFLPQHPAGPKARYVLARLGEETWDDQNQRLIPHATRNA